MSEDRVAFGSCAVRSLDTLDFCELAGVCNLDVTDFHETLWMGGACAKNKRIQIECRWLNEKLGFLK